MEKFKEWSSGVGAHEKEAFRSTSTKVANIT